ncbi:hypothetical protein WMY93_004972 [Mugilogobius chulae]|uniref:Uncharacterized protein n=1 Tax=Mugilogobius chulae TaxID=88201 RepID=A0AAW0Q0R0_9GOBI
MRFCTVLYRGIERAARQKGLCDPLQSLSHAGSDTAAQTITKQERATALDSLPFSKAKIGCFFQERPVLKNPFLEDALLTGYLRRHIPHEAVLSDLCAFGERMASEVDAWGRECEVSPPQLVQYDSWGRRVDRIHTSAAWKRMKDLSAQEGLVSIGYERHYGHWSRVYQMSKLFLFSPSSGLYTCPLAMTDGAAKVIESLGISWPVEEAFNRLITRKAEYFWTSGQWMTERQGGSDVANGTETVAVPQTDGSFKLYGYKWFTSATDADMTLTLARVQDPTGALKPGSRGLSLFMLKDQTDAYCRVITGWITCLYDICRRKGCSFNCKHAYNNENPQQFICSRSNAKGGSART